MVTAAPVFAGMTVTLYQDNVDLLTAAQPVGSAYSWANGGEFRAFGNAALNSVIGWSSYNASAAANTTGNDVPNFHPPPTTLYFQTFCVDVDTHFNEGVAYNATLSQTGYNENHPVSSPPTYTAVTLNMGVAWLYSQFAAGTLGGGYTYAYSPARAASAGQLQNAIWYLLGELTAAQLTTYNGVNGTAFVNLAEAHTGGDLAHAQLPSNGAFGVDVLNLTDANGVHIQDQLVIVPEPASILAAALLLALPIGTSALRILRRK